MPHQIRRGIQSAAVLGLMVALAGRADASIALTTPAGLTPGAQFRFIFNTDGTTPATSSNITDYDNFVNTQAGGATYNGVTVTWQVIGSTPSVNAIDHITPTNTPVYLTDGTLVTTSTTTSGLWSGALTHEINEDISGTPFGSIVWTGTTQFGLADGAHPLGSPLAFTITGVNTHLDSGWIDNANSDHNTQLHTLYGISQTLTVPGVPSVVPESSTAILAVFGAVAFLAYGWSRHRREQRRQAAA
jgi:hypothetical protein